MKTNLIKRIKDINEPVNILIKYHNDKLYNLDEENGYKAIPFDFVYKTVLELDSKEFTLLMYLIVRNKYYYVSEYVDPETGEILKKVNEVCYSFPTINNIANRIKVNQHNVDKYTQSLQEKGYITIDKNREKKSVKNNITNKQEIKNMNYTYKVKLLNRFEYIKYHIINIANAELNELPLKDQKYIKSRKAEDILIEYEGSNKLSLNIKNKLFLENGMEE
jgi:DNA-binding MarR family transcriptional regulator